MGFGDTSSKSNATDSRVAADGGASVAHSFGVNFNSGGRKADYTSIILLGGGIALAAWLLWLVWKK